MFGLTFDKLVLIGVIAAFLLGPKRLPAAAATLGSWVRRMRTVTEDAKNRLREEAGPEFDDIDWKKLDPRQYDPRRIIREALLEEHPTPSESTAAAPTEPPEANRSSQP
ncbi:twin-arginine translocase TatA/TatE family subunit [Leifsonia sp. NPDC058230]|uniref:twin-arginine translocase TatA/TatE family subunit n=1 Tax=Leifsonia sp. NPDC058230 TaxID=3346391 RepID=UPI0036D870EB